MSYQFYHTVGGLINPYTYTVTDNYRGGVLYTFESCSGNYKHRLSFFAHRLLNSLEIEQEFNKTVELEEDWKTKYLELSIAQYFQPL